MDEYTMKTYEVPQVITYTDEEILDELGPAQTVYGSTSGSNGLGW